MVNHDGKDQAKANPVARALHEVAKGASSVTKKTAKAASNVSRGAAVVLGRPLSRSQNDSEAVTSSEKSLSKMSSTTNSHSYSSAKTSAPLRSRSASSDSTVECVPKAQSNSSRVSLRTKPSTSKIAKVPSASLNEVEKSLKVDKMKHSSILDLVAADSMLLLVVSSSIAIIPTIANFYDVVNNRIPFSVMGCWMLVSYVFGQVFRISLSDSRILSNTNTLVTIKSEPNFIEEELVTTSAHPEVQLEDEKNVPHSGNKRSIWTVLSRGKDKDKQFAWERNIDVIVDKKGNSLMNRLLKNKRLRRTPKDQFIQRMSSRMLTVVSDDTAFPPSLETHASDDSNVGSFSSSFITPQSFGKDDIIDPMFVLRGMDIFLTDDPESEAATHPFLIENGLRDVPTCIVNIETQWGNILLYYDMSDYIQDWDTFKDEKDDDPDDVKALKRFVNGTDEFRNARLKCIPSVVEAPLAVRLLAPAKSEIVVHGAMVALSWKKHNKSIDSNGRKLDIALEVKFDLMSSRLVRNVASIVKSNLQRLLVDVAMVISKPEGQVHDEPVACLGFWRFNRVDISSAPPMPDRYATLERTKSIPAGIARASIVMGLNPEDFGELITKEQH